MFDAVLLMAGKGSRTGLQSNKALYPVNGIPLYQYALQAFLALEECHHVVLVIHPDEKNLVSLSVNPRIIITTGGQERQDSVASGVEACCEDIVLVHDAARPNINIEDIRRVYQATIKHQTALLAIPVVDTIKLVEDELVQRTLPRHHLWAAQTPQGFNRLLYLECMKLARQEAYVGWDDVEIIEQFAHLSPMIVKGRQDNIKVTTAFDLVI
ncbi:MAG: 2-C-methyl-D-erythritol 4-phosphate cytidylyltransferase, partial [Bacilli bacterium]